MSEKRKADLENEETVADQEESQVESPEELAGKIAKELEEDLANEIEEELEEEAEAEPEISREDQLILERDGFRDKWMRAVAETDNVRKRSRKEVNDARRFAMAESVRAFLDVYDTFERALQSMPTGEDNEQVAKMHEGIELIFQKFQGALKDRGAVLIDAVGSEFDPNVHEAVGQLPREGVEPGMVIEVAQQGFKIQDMVLRPARVIVSS